MLDSTYDFFVKSFKLKTKELDAEDALARARDLGRFFAVEMNYKGQPVRMIVAASGVPVEQLLNGGAATETKLLS